MKEIIHPKKGVQNHYLGRKVHKCTTSPSYSSLAQFETTEEVIALKCEMCYPRQIDFTGNTQSNY